MTSVQTIPIELLRNRSKTNHKFVKQYLAAGFDIFSVPVSALPHYEFAVLCAKGVAFDYATTSYYKQVEFALGCYRKIGTRCVSNTGIWIRSAQFACEKLATLFESVQKIGNTTPMRLKALLDGTYEIQDGTHRAAILLALDHTIVEANIVSADRGLANLSGSLANMYPGNGKHVLYIPIEHPAFNDWKALRDSTRWDLIAGEGGWRDCRVLDIGSYTGYFSHKVASLGAIVVGVEPDATRYSQSCALNSLLRLSVDFRHESVEHYLSTNPTVQFDCAFCFSVLHWTLKRGGVEALHKLLSLVSAASPVMFMDMGQSHEPKMQTKEWNHGLVLSDSIIPKLILDNSRYAKHKILGVGDTGRTVFKFYR